MRVEMMTEALDEMAAEWKAGVRAEMSAERKAEVWAGGRAAVLTEVLPAARMDGSRAEGLLTGKKTGISTCRRNINVRGKTGGINMLICAAMPS